MNKLLSSILSILYSFELLRNSSIKTFEKIELPFEEACVIEQQATLFVTRELSYPTFQFCRQYWRIITLPVRYLSTPSYCMQDNNYHTLLQFDTLQYKTTCRARCGFLSIGRFLRFFSRSIVSVLFPAVVRITGFL